jgi:hypothetical protein
MSTKAKISLYLGILILAIAFLSQYAGGVPKQHQEIKIDSIQTTMAEKLKKLGLDKAKVGEVYGLKVYEVTENGVVFIYEKIK